MPAKESRNLELILFLRGAGLRGVPAVLVELAAARRIERRDLRVRTAGLRLGHDGEGLGVAARAVAGQVFVRGGLGEFIRVVVPPPADLGGSGFR